MPESSSFHFNSHMSTLVTETVNSCTTLPSITIYKIAFRLTACVGFIMDVSIIPNDDRSNDIEARAECLVLSLIVISTYRSILIFSSRLDRQALSPPLHAFSSETPNSIINSRLFLERLWTRISGMCEARAKTLSHLGQVYTPETSKP